MNPTVRTLLVTLTLAGAAATSARAQDYQLIVNEAVPASSMAETEIARVFQRTATRWPNGLTVEPVDQADGATIRERFTEDLFHKTAAQMHAYWQTQIFSGTTVPPVVLPSEAQVISFVQGHAGAIAYVSSGASLPLGVKRLRIVGR